MDEHREEANGNTLLPLIFLICVTMSLVKLMYIGWVFLSNFILYLLLIRVFKNQVDDWMRCFITVFAIWVKDVCNANVITKTP